MDESKPLRPPADDRERVLARPLHCFGASVSGHRGRGINSSFAAVLRSCDNAVASRCFEYSEELGERRIRDADARDRGPRPGLVRMHRDAVRPSRSPNASFE
jgi:hypothetical protein